MDAQTNHASEYASGDDPSTNFGITETGDGLHLKTTYTYDRRGRLSTVTMPGGRVTRVYYTRLDDGRLVTLSVPKYVDTTTDVFHGPVSYSVINLAGKAEASGVIAFSGGTTTSDISTWIDEADANPTTAVDVGTLSRYSVSLHDESGTQLEESRAYTSLSTPSYDATTYAYDDMGRRIRTEDPTGTVTRATYDVRGNMSDDDEHYRYVYDAWGRLVKIKNLSNATVTEYEYNGLGHRIGHKWDTDGNASLEWQWMLYDDKWRVIARFEDGAAVSEPFEQVYHHHAGVAGYGG